jgi:hypothetical protein
MNGGDDMAKDDYFVIVYQILAYLYQRLKKGEKADPKALEHDSPLFKINARYWAYIIHHMSKAGLIEGVCFMDIDGLETPYPAQMEDCRITPAGIEYLCDNSLMEKAKSFLKDIKEIAPFV